jgi:hypothetical protein
MKPRVKVFDSRSLLQQSRINKALAQFGLGQLHEEGLLDQIGFLVRDHEHFRKILLKLDPVQRQNCYISLAPRLNFKPKPLDEYVAEEKMIASEKASHDEITPEVGEKLLASLPPTKMGIVKVQAGIQRAKLGLDDEDTAQAVARGRLTVVCLRCTKEETVYAMSKLDAYETLVSLGWKLEEKKAWCPECKPKPVA